MCGLSYGDDCFRWRFSAPTPHPFSILLCLFDPESELRGAYFSSLMIKLQTFHTEHDISYSAVSKQIHPTIKLRYSHSMHMWNKWCLHKRTIHRFQNLIERWQPMFIMHKLISTSAAVKYGRMVENENQLVNKMNA